MTFEPYVPDLEKWRRHFVNMAEGKTRRNKNGKYVVGAIHQEGGKTVEPVIQMVTPVAAAVGLAKSELAQEEEEKERYGPKVYKRPAPWAMPKVTAVKKKPARGLKRKATVVSGPPEKKTIYYSDIYNR